MEWWWCMDTSDEDKKIAWKSCDENKEFPWDMPILREADTVSGEHRFDWHKSVSKKRNRKAAGSSRWVPNTVKPAGEAGIGMATNLTNQVLVENVIA